jgi:hypothetical protein
VTLPVVTVGAVTLSVNSVCSAVQSWVALEAVAGTIDQIVELNRLQIGRADDHGGLDKAQLPGDGLNDLQEVQLCHIKRSGSMPRRSRTAA